MIVVERLSTQDQNRIVRLIGLLFEASDELREQTQQMLRELIARQPETRSHCLTDIDRIIAGVERKLEIELLFASGRGSPKHIAENLL